MYNPPPTSEFTAQLLKVIDSLGGSRNKNIARRAIEFANRTKPPAAACFNPLATGALAQLAAPAYVLCEEDPHPLCPDAKRGLFPVLAHPAVDDAEGVATSDKTAGYFMTASGCIEDRNAASDIPYHLLVPPNAHGFTTPNAHANVDMYQMTPLGTHARGVPAPGHTHAPFEVRLPHHHDHKDKPDPWDFNPRSSFSDIFSTPTARDETADVRPCGAIVLAPYGEYLSRALEDELPLPKCGGTGGSEFHAKVMKGNYDLGAMHERARRKAAAAYNAHQDFAENIKYYVHSDSPIPDCLAPHVAFLRHGPPGEVMAVYGIHSETYMGPAPPVTAAAPRAEDDEAAACRRRLSAEILLRAIVRNEYAQAAASHNTNELAHVCGSNCSGAGHLTAATPLPNDATAPQYLPAPAHADENATPTTERTDPFEYDSYCSAASNDGDTVGHCSTASDVGLVTRSFHVMLPGRRPSGAYLLRSHNSGGPGATGPSPSQPDDSTTDSGSGTGDTGAVSTGTDGDNPGDSNNDDGNNRDGRGRPVWSSEDVPGYKCEICGRPKSYSEHPPTGYLATQICWRFWKPIMEDITARNAATRSPPIRCYGYVSPTAPSAAQLALANRPPPPLYDVEGIDHAAVQRAAARHAANAESSRAAAALPDRPPTPEPRTRFGLGFMRPLPAEPRLTVAAPDLVPRRDTNKIPRTRAETAARLRNADIDASIKFSHLPSPPGPRVSAFAPAAGPEFCSGPPREEYGLRSILNYPILNYSLPGAGSRNYVVGFATNQGSVAPPAAVNSLANGAPNGTPNAGPNGTNNYPGATNTPTLVGHVTFQVGAPPNGGTATVTRVNNAPSGIARSLVANRPPTPFPSPVVPPFVLDTPSAQRSARTVVRAFGFAPAVAPGTAPAPAPARCLTPARARAHARASARPAPAAVPAPAPAPAPPAPAAPALAGGSTHATSAPIPIPGGGRPRQNLGDFVDTWCYSDGWRPRRSSVDDDDEDKAKSLPLPEM